MGGETGDKREEEWGMRRRGPWNGPTYPRWVEDAESDLKELQEEFDKLNKERESKKMANSKFTPGPWKVDKGIFIVAPGTMIETDKLVCRVYETAVLKSESGHIKSDACLIAAAPDLYKACELGLLVAIQDANFRQIPEEERAAIHILQDALAKAEGEVR